MIRQAVKEDMYQIMEIYNDAIINTTAIYSYKPQTIEEMLLWFEKKKEGNFPVLVFEEGNIIAGFATFGPFRLFPAYKYTIEHSVYVHKNFRKQGIGNALVKQIIKIAEEREYKTIVAGIDASNKSSIIMHEKLGFQYSGTIKNAGFKFGRWLDLVFYQFNLTGPKNPIDD